MVSVIIPNYCHARYLKQRIDSVLAQTYTDFEIILLDDCSTDDSRAVIEQYRNHPKVTHIIYNTQNSGSTFAQWHKGFNLAAGEYIWIAESDDYAHPDFLKVCMQQLEKIPDCTLAYTESILVDKESQPVGRREKCAQHSRKACDIWDGRDFVICNMMTFNAVYNASMAVFRKSAIPTDTRYTTFHLNGDWLFWCEIILAGKVAHINNDYNCFRQHDAKVTNKVIRSGLILHELSVLPEILLDKVKLENKYLCWYVLGRIYRTARAIKRKVNNTIDFYTGIEDFYEKYGRNRLRLMALWSHIYRPLRPKKKFE